MPPQKIILSTKAVKIVKRKLAEKSLHEFCKQAWSVVEPGTEFIDGNHIRVICEHLEAVTRGEILKLIIAVPPRTMKSLLTSVFWFAWTWIHDPESRWLYSSFGQNLARRDSRKCREVIESAWYQENWGDKFKLKGDANTVDRYENDKQGFRMATSVGSSATGEGGSHIIVDDAHKADDRFSPVALEAACNWWTTTMSTRGNTPQARRVIIGQRIHENDLIGHLLRKEKGYEVLCFPMRYESDHPFPSRTSLGVKDWRTQDGELLWPQRFNEEAVNDLVSELEDSYNIAGQLQQRPAPAEGGMFSPSYFRYFQEEIDRDDGNTRRVFVFNDNGRIRRVPARSCFWFQTVDTALEVKDTSAWTVVLTACITPAPVKLLIVDIYRERLPVPRQYAAIQEQRRKHKLSRFTAVEKKASGHGIIQQGAMEGVPFKILQAEGDKSKRAVAIAVQYENGLVYHLAGASWLERYEHELLLFPAGEFADQVDTAAYAGLIFQARNRKRQRSEQSLVYRDDPANKPKDENKKTLAELLTGRKPGQARESGPGW